uniref:Uncharacterized protein n=1 Tax=Setaria viridis TaxID=4556 RepID=A0A4U6U0P0_SETVI|nr:hypothetical protein SEVIR_6G063500v2 [Setaria viridis]
MNGMATSSTICCQLYPLFFSPLLSCRRHPSPALFFHRRPPELKLLFLFLLLLPRTRGMLLQLIRFPSFQSAQTKHMPVPIQAATANHILLPPPPNVKHQKTPMRSDPPAALGQIPSHGPQLFSPRLESATTKQLYSSSLPNQPHQSNNNHSKASSIPPYPLHSCLQ